MRILNSFIASAFFGLALSTAGYAQTPEGAPYIDTTCGTWQVDTWTPNGTCAGDVKRHTVVEGTITIVKGHLVTVQQSAGAVVVDDTPALSNQFTGRVAVGRRIVAHGYWDANNFYATIITTAATNPQARAGASTDVGSLARTLERRAGTKVWPSERAIYVTPTHDAVRDGVVLIAAGPSRIGGMPRAPALRGDALTSGWQGRK